MTLPTPDPAFHWATESWGHALRCNPLAELTGHLFTSRQRQLPDSSPAEGASGQRLTPTEAWRPAAASLGGGEDTVMRVAQVHGRTVRLLRRGRMAPDEARRRPEADALVSDAPGLLLAVQVADCVPILIVDPTRGAAAAVHAGWRGTCAGIVAAAVEAMSDAFGSSPRHLTAAIGPSIGACCYEVGPEVVESFAATGRSSPDWFTASGAARWRLDLWAANIDQLCAAGIPAHRVFLAGLCTRTHADVFDSFRADGARAGRMAALIRVPAAGGGGAVIESAP